MQRSATDVKSGAGRYFTLRPLIRAMVEAAQPTADDTVVDPACGTGGFLLSVIEYIEREHNAEMTPEQRWSLSEGHSVRGVELVDATARLATMNMYLHGVGRAYSDPVIDVRDALATTPTRRASVALANPPFGKRSSITVVGENGKAEREDIAYSRTDFWVTTTNKQLNFVQHIASLLAPGGRGRRRPGQRPVRGWAGETVRRRLMRDFDVHTLLRLPTGIFYAGGVKANVLFFDRPLRAREGEVRTETLWVYDFRTAQHFTLKQRPLRDEHLVPFLDAYQPGADRAQREEGERGKPFRYDELAARDKRTSTSPD